MALWALVGAVTMATAPSALGDLALSSPSPEGLIAPDGVLGRHTWSIERVEKRPSQWWAAPLDAWRGLSLDGISIVSEGTAYAPSPIDTHYDHLTQGLLEGVDFSLGLRGDLGFAGLDGDSSPMGSRTDSRHSDVGGNAAGETVLRPPTDHDLVGNYRSDQTPSGSATALSDFRNTRGSGLWDSALGDGEILVPRRERPPQVPSPSAVALGLLGLCLAAGLRKRLG
jgi:MYXO-CTERM domain-containing protein